MSRAASSPSMAGDNQAQMLEEVQRLAEYAQRLIVDLENAVDKTSHRLVHVTKRAEDVRQEKLNPLVSQLRGQEGKALASKRANEKRFKPTRGFGYTVADVFREDTRPAEMNRLRNACRDTPDFSVFEKVSPGCSLKFSNPGFFYQEWSRAQTKQTEDEERKLSEEKEARKRNKERKKKLDTSTLSAPEGGDGDASTRIPGGEAGKPTSANAPIRPARAPRPPSQVSTGTMSAPPPPEAPRRIARPPSAASTAEAGGVVPVAPSRAARPASVAIGPDGAPIRPPRAATGGAAPAPERPQRQPTSAAAAAVPSTVAGGGPERPPRAASMRGMVVAGGEVAPPGPPPPLPRPTSDAAVMARPQSPLAAEPLQQQPPPAQSVVARPARSRPTPPPPPPPQSASLSSSFGGAATTTPVDTSVPIHDKTVEAQQRPKRAQAPPPPPSLMQPLVTEQPSFQPSFQPAFEAEMPAKRPPMVPVSPRTHADDEEEDDAPVNAADQEASSPSSGVASAALEDPVLRKFAMMQKMNMPQGAIEQAMVRANVDPALLFGESASLKLGGSAPVVIKIEPRKEQPMSAARPSSIMDEIAQGGRTLRKVESPSTPPASSSSSNELMQGILSQRDKLKRVEAPPPEAKKPAGAGHLDGGGVASILARRIAIIGDKGSDDDDDSGGSDWDDDDD